MVQAMAIQRVVISVAVLAVLLLGLGLAGQLGGGFLGGVKDPVATADSVDDVGFIAGLAEQAAKRAQANGSELLLRQIDVDLRNGLFVFRFTDADAVQAVTVMAPVPRRRGAHGRYSETRCYPRASGK
jgi:hypothetical protein